MKSLKSHLLFNRQQRGGILFLILLVTGLLCFYFFVDFTSWNNDKSKDTIFDISSTEIMALQNEIDSLRNVEIENRIFLDCGAELEVQQENTLAINFYKKYGFYKISVTNNNSMIMQKRLI